MLVATNRAAMVKSSPAASTEASASINKRKQALPRPKLSKLCDKCDFGTNDEGELVEHMKLEHNSEDVHFCDLCAFSTESLWDFQLHMEQHSNK